MSTTEYRTGGIRKHSSTDEYNYFRGVAATVGVLPYLDISAFYSHRSMDGVVEDGEITSIYKTGLHRTQKEADKMNAFALQVIGGNMTYEKNSLKVGVTGIYYFFDRPYKPRLNKYAKYNLHGSDFYNVGMDYRYRLGRLVWVGEAATGSKGYALLNRLKYGFLPIIICYLFTGIIHMIIGLCLGIPLAKAVCRRMRTDGIWQQRPHLSPGGSFSLHWMCFLFLGGNTV